jgi:hypothetical protein
MKGYRQSNPGPPSTSGRLTSNPANGGGPQAWRGGAIGCSPDFRSRALRAMVTRGFGGKMAWGRRGPYPRRNAAGNGSMMARTDGFPPSSTGDGEQWLRRSSGFKKQLNAFLMASSCF